MSSPDLYTETQQERELRVLEEASTSAAQRASGRAPRRTRLLAAGLAFLIAASPLAYILLGTPATLRPPTLAPTQPTAEQIEEFVEALAGRLESAPDDLEGWRMLARSQHVLGRYEHAANAYARVLALGGRDADVLVRYADSLTRANSGRIDDEAYRHIKEALALDRRHAAALALAGHAEVQRGNYAASADLWEKLARELPPDSEIAPDVRGLIDNARKHAAAADSRSKVDTESGYSRESGSLLAKRPGFRADSTILRVQRAADEKAGRRKAATNVTIL